MCGRCGAMYNVMRIKVCVHMHVSCILYSGLLPLKGTSLNQDTMHGPSYIEEYTKLPLRNEDTSFNQDTFSYP